MGRSQWEREFELKWRTYSGVRVFEDFSKTLHVNNLNEDPILGLPVLIGIDFGLTPACVFCQLAGLKLSVLDELVAWNEPISEFSLAIKARLQQRFPDMEHMEFVDPAGFHRSQVDGRRCVDELYKHGFAPQPGAMGFVERKESIVTLLNRLYKGEPQLKINPRCEWLIGGFEGGYRYDEQIAKKEYPLKNEFSHVADALQYVASQTKYLHGPKSTIKVKRAVYGFQRRK